MTDALDRAILDALDRATAPMNAVQIADVTGIHHESIQYALNLLCDERKGGPFVSVMLDTLDADAAQEVGA